VALGWGLWEGPARFIFGHTSFRTFSDTQFRFTFSSTELDQMSIVALLSRLTFVRSGITYRTDNSPPGPLSKDNEAASHHWVSERHSRRFFRSCKLWHFCALDSVRIAAVKDEWPH